MRATRDRLDIFILSDMVQIKRGRKSIELMPLDEADALGRDLCLAVAAARATQPFRHPRPAPPKEPAAVQTTAQILRGIRSVVAENPQLTFDGILLTMYEPGNPVSERVAAHVRAQLPQLVFETAVPRTVASLDACAAGQPIVLRTPADPAAQAYLALADQLAPLLR